MLARKEIYNRIHQLKGIEPVENSFRGWLERLLEIASGVRYYNSQGEPDEAFDSLLTELRTFYHTHQIPAFDGKMEPSQALLYTVLEHLRKITAGFNERWEDFIPWYLCEKMGVLSRPAVPSHCWYAFNCHCGSPVRMEKGTPFYGESAGGKRYTYRMDEDLLVQDIEIGDAWSVYFERKKDRYPAGFLRYITSVRCKDLLQDPIRREMMFAEERNPHFAKALGLMIAHPALLLKEGKRTVTLRFHAENREWQEELEQVVTLLKEQLEDWTEDKIRFELFNNLFYITISVPDGWMQVTEYAFHPEDDGFRIRFTLPGELPPTSPCTDESHAWETHDPVVRIYPDFDAWLYPYSWLSLFQLCKVTIGTRVENVRNILLYNELGRIDNSAPFQLLGIHTGKGAWFVAGHYEMAQKHILDADILIQWGPLPEQEKGLKEYYQGYGVALDNNSFRMRTKYLNDYTWKHTPNTGLYPLFCSVRTTSAGEPVADAPLARHTLFRGIRLDRMLPVNCTEEEYEYSIRSRSGFIECVLEEPVSGLGEEEYRRAFTRQMMEFAWKKKEPPVLNPPLNPVVERMTLNYSSLDEIDLRTGSREETGTIWQIHPLGIIPVGITPESRTISFVYTPDSDANFLLSLQRVKGGEVIRLFLQFVSVRREQWGQQLPEIEWSWGNRRIWKELSSENILEDTTNNFLTSGYLKIRLPEMIPPDMRDMDGKVWLRAAITRYEKNVPDIQSVFINAMRLSLEIEEKEEDELSEAFRFSGELNIGRKLPGLIASVPITTCYGGQPKEDPTALQTRIGGYIRHRGRAVTAKDYEQLLLDAFPELGLVKCIPGFNETASQPGVLSILLLPCLSGIINPLQPMTPTGVLLEVREFLKGHVPSVVKEIIVMNPEYVPVLVRCSVRFGKEVSVPSAKAGLKEKINDYIAGWRKKEELPVPGKGLSLPGLMDLIRTDPSVEAVRHLSVVRIPENRKQYKIYEYGRAHDFLPVAPHRVYIPVTEHTVAPSVWQSLGIEEMEIDQTLIIS